MLIDNDLANIVSMIEQACKSHWPVAMLLVEVLTFACDCIVPLSQQVTMMKGMGMHMSNEHCHQMTFANDAGDGPNKMKTLMAIKGNYC